MSPPAPSGPPIRSRRAAYVRMVPALVVIIVICVVAFAKHETKVGVTLAITGVVWTLVLVGLVAWFTKYGDRE